jgi:hypothetical protein
VIVTQIAASRGIVPLVGAASVMSVAGWLVRDMSLTLEIHWYAPPYEAEFAELTVIASAALIAGFARPRFWEWERLGGWRTRAVCGAVAGVCLLASLGPAVAATTMSGGVLAIEWRLANAILVAALVGGMAPLVGAFGAGCGAIVMWLCSALAYNLELVSPGMLLLASPANPSPHWIGAGVLAGVAIIVHMLTLGMSTRVWRRGMRGQETSG